MKCYLLCDNDQTQRTILSGQQGTAKMANNVIDIKTSAPNLGLEDTEAPSETVNSSWIDSLVTLVQHTAPSVEARTRIVITCDITEGERVLYIPPDMAELQPDSQRYLEAFANAHELQLVEDQRRVKVQPAIEKRDQDTPLIARALSELLRQSGLPGKTRPQSKPHRLAVDSQHIDLYQLIHMTALATPDAKRAIIQPNRHLKQVLHSNEQPIKAYGCRLMSADINTILSHFVSPEFHAIGYSTGTQYVLHVFLAGGSISSPQMWSDFHTLTLTDFRFQLFNAAEASNDLGLFYATFYLDLAESPAPWWLDSFSEQSDAQDMPSEPILLKHAS